jgi:hypothetical protein
MRQGVDTVKPDVHVRRFAEATVGRKLSDQVVIELTTEAAARIGILLADLERLFHGHGVIKRAMVRGGDRAEPRRRNCNRRALARASDVAYEPG